MSRHPYIEALTTSLTSDPTSKAKAHAMLEQSLNPDAPDLDDLATRLHTANPTKLRQTLPWIAACLALVLAAFASSSSIRTIYHLSNWEIFEPALGMPPPDLAGLTKHEQLLLGVPGIEPLEQKRRLHQFDPTNPAYFFEYAIAWVVEHEELPPDFLETAKRIDPDNAAFLYFAAVITGRESTKTLPRSGPSEPRHQDGVRIPSAMKETEFEIIDEAKFLEAAAMIKEAAKLPKFRTYWNDMVRARIRILPSGTVMEMIHSTIHALSPTSRTIHIRLISDILSAKAEMLSKNGDIEEFLALTEERDAVITHIANYGDLYLVSEIVHRVIATGTSVNFHAAAERLELDVLAEAYRMQRDGFQARRDAQVIRFENKSNPFSQQQFSILTAHILPTVARQVESPPPISESELKPIRFAEHELFGAIATLTTAILILLAGLMFFLVRFLFPRFIRLPAARMAAAPGTTDVLWVILLGVALPIGLFLLATRLTPLGGRDFNLQTHAIFPAAQYAALLIALLLAPLIVARWRLSRLLAPLGLPARVSTFTLIALASLGLWVFVTYPLFVNYELSWMVRLILIVPLVLFICLVAATLFRIIKGVPVKRLAQAATLIAALPAYPIAAIALLALLPLHQSSEKRWIAQETLLRIDPDAPDLGAYEFRVAAQLRKETNTILGLE